MSQIRKDIEKGFESFAGVLIRYRFIVLILMLALVAGLGSFTRNLVMDTSTEGFLHKTDPALVTYDRFRDQFGRDETVILSLTPPKIFDQAFLEKLKKMHRELEDKVPYVDEVTSLINARNTRGEGDRLIVEDLLEDMPRNKEEMQALEQRVMQNPLYLNRLISKDGKTTNITIKTYARVSEARKDTQSLLEGFDEPETKDKPLENGRSGHTYITGAQNSEVVVAIKNIADRYRGPDLPIRMAGSPSVTHFLSSAVQQDTAFFVRLALIAIGTLLFILFRRITGVVLPLLVVAFSVISTLGLMALSGTSFSVPTMILPSFLLAVGVGASVHILSIFYQALNQGMGKKESIVHALGHSGLAVVITSLTTAAGLASFAMAEIAPVSALGIFASTGVMLSLVYTVVLLPTLLAIIPIKPKHKKAKANHHARMDGILNWISIFSAKRAKAIVLVCLVLTLASVAGFSRLTLSHDPLIWLPENSPVRLDTEFLNQVFDSSVNMEVLIDTGKENGLYDLAVLNTLDRMEKEVEAFKHGRFRVGNTLSLVDILKEINQALNENNPAKYKVPQNPALIPQEFLLFENSGSDDLEDVVDTSFSVARFSILSPWMDTVAQNPALDRLTKHFNEAFDGKAKVTITGMVPLLVRVMNASVMSAAESYILAFMVITFLMILLIGSIRLGVLSMFPNLLPIFITMGIMGWFNIPLDMYTMLIGSIAIGLAVDDTVHFMHNFRRYYFETNNVAESIRLTLFTTGRAMLVTSIVLCAGFFLYMFASMNNLFHFGLLTGTTILLALAADFFLAPALMVLAHKKDKPEASAQAAAQ
ncbi:efflux RND transporter permease subunit [Dethiosulfatarculus sandiegensis]|uniref:SSD domain-containing protein n=1 Tax=Dethiosulfatarculus sandiegensis TaxID=1429043 RepID=A0A0D2GCF1_9BACT|nr:MMPL family transporter [Dethiosulfatarculus sandiegensis]KIX12572.1 hypothetical protein X474_18380 [Dethiosulfatarculus sandiegensis]